MASTATTPAPESIGAVGRLTGALFSPKPTFADIARRPSWLAPLVVLCVMSIAVVAIFTQRAGWRDFMERQFDKNSRIQNMPADQRAQALERAVKFAPIQGYAFAVGGTIIGALLVAGIYLGLFNGIAGTQLNYKTSLGIVSHAWMPYLIHGLLGILILYVRDPASLDIQNLVASNPGALLSSSSPGWLQSLAGSFDVFTFWVLFLLAVGYSAAGPKKLSVGKAFIYALIPWVAYVLVKVGFAAVFS